MKDIGGPAFPEPAINGFGPQPGMTLRDYFAGQALISLIINNNISADDVAVASYYVADAMLKARDND